MVIENSIELILLCIKFYKPYFQEKSKTLSAQKLIN